jgi:hypothetical protein
MTQSLPLARIGDLGCAIEGGFPHAKNTSRKLRLAWVSRHELYTANVQGIDGVNNRIVTLVGLIKSTTYGKKAKPEPFMHAWMDAITGTLYLPDDGICLSSKYRTLDVSSIAKLAGEREDMKANEKAALRMKALTDSISPKMANKEA